jgi:hypothetical protein
MNEILNYFIHYLSSSFVNSNSNLSLTDQSLQRSAIEYLFDYFSSEN